MSTDNKITRRDALKRMGTAVVSGAVASSGLLSLTSCEGRKNKRIILYFTGTGNCLYIARQLAGKNAELLSIPQLVKQGNRHRLSHLRAHAALYGTAVHPEGEVEGRIQVCHSHLRRTEMQLGGDLGRNIPKSRSHIRLHRNHHHGG